MKQLLKIPFTKMQATGNDFILLNFLEDGPELSPSLIRQMCERRTGIGADGIIIICSSEHADFQMRIFNSDGSEGEMCGNGISCFSMLVSDLCLIDNSNEITIETKAGIIKTRHLQMEGKKAGVKVNMGFPIFNKNLIPMLGDGDYAFDEGILIEDTTFKVSSILMGVPHTILYTENIDKLKSEEFRRVGKSIEECKYYPRKTNVMFTEIINKHHLKIKPWERGAGETLGCGTGSCAAAVISIMTGRSQNPVKVENPGGILHVEWEDGKPVYMTALADIVFTGVWEMESDESS